MNSELACPTCETTGHDIGTSLGEPVIQCPACELCYLRASVRPGSSSDNGWYGDMTDYPAGAGEAYVDIMGDAYARQVAELSRLTTGRDLLDVGCGLGVFLAVAKRHGWNAVGVDESPHASAFAAKQYGLRYLSSLDESEPAAWDVVRSSHVIEHVPDPRSFLAALRRVIKPGGVLHLIMPNREPLTAMVRNRVRKLRGDRRLVGAIYPSMHVLGLSTRSLSEMLSREGFVGIDATTVSMGDRTYYPMLYDGLLRIRDPRTVKPKEWLGYFGPRVVDGLGNRVGLGTWIVCTARLG